MLLACPGLPRLALKFDLRSAGDANSMQNLNAFDVRAYRMIFESGYLCLLKCIYWRMHFLESRTPTIQERPKCHALFESFRACSGLANKPAGYQKRKIIGSPVGVVG